MSRRAWWLLLVSQLGGLIDATTHESALQRSQVRLERMTAALLDAVEAQCLTPPPSRPSEERPSVAVALAALKGELRRHYNATGSFDCPIQREVWAGARIVAATANQNDRVQDAVAITELIDGYSQPARFAADIAQIMFAAETLTACPTAKKTGVIIGHYFAHLEGRDHANNPEEEVRYVTQLRKWSQVHAAELGLRCLVVHDGIRSELLAETQHPNLEFVHVNQLPLQGLSWGGGDTSTSFIDTRYHVHLAAIDMLSARQPTPDFILLADFIDVAFDRNPFAWMSLLDDKFDLFMNYEVEGNIGWLLSQTRECFGNNPRTVSMGEALVSGTMHNPGVIAGSVHAMRSMVMRFIEIGSLIGTDHSKGYAGCDMAFANRVMWDSELQRSEPHWRVYSGVPFSAPFRWARYPDRDPWTRTGNRWAYCIHK
jgi:hypothetical protein